MNFEQENEKKIITSTVILTPKDQKEIMAQCINLHYSQTVSTPLKIFYNFLKIFLIIFSSLLSYTVYIYYTDSDVPNLLNDILVNYFHYNHNVRHIQEQLPVFNIVQSQSETGIFTTKNIIIGVGVVVTGGVAGGAIYMGFISVYSGIAFLGLFI